ncbi:type I restriction enzyme EcoAI specificity protein [Thermodesulfovibrio yellowstonii DSM 11347]|uniref:Type I restriction enzyme EcoAI specificity protein n=1 Tax=Thermodesulfovibrio yellowstonii (strain ATCC 51303 / DSM 11347 / YP87) TaxID=289376 RepID=B5YGZ3_THEYD|nr:type I restriction enzyme EcoAI specificity protein [Thermodesulfovibrio yellowstonii DSM 11347]
MEQGAHFQQSPNPKSQISNLKSIYPPPPLPEQQQIVSEIERRFSVVEQIEGIVDQSLKQAERLRQSILKKAFEGKLVPQDPNDEPAEKLLERIKIDKAKQTNKNKIKSVRIGMYE